MKIFPKIEVGKIEIGKYEVGFALCLLAILCLSILFHHRDTRDLVDGALSNFAQVRGAGWIEKGWIPAILPEDSTSIWYHGDTAKSRDYGGFHTARSREILQRCTPVPDATDISPVLIEPAMPQVRAAMDLRRWGWETVRCEGFLVIFSAAEEKVYFASLLPVDLHSR